MKIAVLFQAIGFGLIIIGVWYELHALKGPTPADEKLEVLLNGIASYQLRPDLMPEEKMQVNAIMGRDGEN